MDAHTLRKLRFPAWLALVAILGTMLMPAGASAADPHEHSDPCAQLTADGPTSVSPCCESVKADKACTGDTMDCAHFCSALIYTPVFNLDVVTAFHPGLPPGLNPSWREQPPHPPPQA